MADRPEGGTKRVFSEADIQRLKALGRPLELPVPRSASGRPERSASGRPPDLPVVFPREEEFLATMAAIRAELAATRQQNERQTEELAAIREDLAREREAARRREEELTARLESILEEVSRPWWVRLWGKR